MLERNARTQRERERNRVKELKGRKIPSKSE